MSKEKKIERATTLPWLRSFTTSRPFFSFLIMTTLFAAPFLSLKANAANDAKQLAEEYTEEEKREYTKELLSLGDELFEQKVYDQAYAAYEQVFMFDPQNKKASAKMDLLKKQMVKEGRDETSLVNGIYEEEAKERTRKYWKETRDYLNEKRYGQARFSLEKILLLDPFNQEAKDLYEKLKAKSVEETAGQYEKREAL